MVVPTAPERSENAQSDGRTEIKFNPELSETQFAFAPVVGLRASFGLRWPSSSLRPCPTFALRT